MFLLFADKNLVQVTKVAHTGGKKSHRPVLQTLRKRFANEIIEIFGIHIDALTANEAQYLVGFRTSDEIRNRCLKAKKKAISDFVQKELQGSLGQKMNDAKLSN